ncbi:MAG: halocyanin domain-containing protein [Haloferacaceae archaeon]
MRDTIDRRTLLRTGAIAAAGLFAGCSGGGGGEGTTAAETESGGGGDGDGGGGGDVPAAVSDFLADAGNFDGSVADRTGQSEVTVEVGAQGNGGNFAFAPPAVRVDAGTTVVWEWTGQGGQHNVVAREGAGFESELVSEAGHTFSWTAEGDGPVTYVCVPHESLGMKGAVVIA